MPDGAAVLRMEADPSALDCAMEFVRTGGVAAGFAQARLDELDLVVEELFLNVARYAYTDGGDRAIELRYSHPRAGLLAVEIADQGVAYNPLTREEPNLRLSLAERPVGGLGIFLVRRIVDGVQYHREAGWNRLAFEMGAEVRLADR